MDLLVYPRCAGALRVIAAVDQPEVIEQLLAHLGLWPMPAYSPPVSLAA